MGDRSTLTGEACGVSPRETVACDQAVFTSVRSLMGEGYRLIGASAGVMPQEKADLVRFSPSHGALCGSSEGQAVGLLSYTLVTGRRCVAYCIHAGREQSGRGGDRVYTHMVLMDRAGFALFDSDVTGVHRALAEVVARTGPILSGETSLDLLPVGVPRLPITDEGKCTLSCLPGTAAEWLWPVAGAVLAGRRVMLIGMDDPFGFLKWLLWILPRSARERLDVSVNVSFSPARHLKLVFLPAVTVSVAKLATGQSFSLWRVGDAVPTIEPVFAPWLGLLRELWSRDRLVDLIGLVAQVPGRVCAESLNHVADKFRCLELQDMPAVPREHGS